MKKKNLFSLILCGAFAAMTAFAAAVVTNTKIGLTRAEPECTTHDLNHYDAVEATLEHPGNVEYWVCCKCHKSFSDAEATHQIANTDVSAKKDHIVEGDGRYVPALDLMSGLNGDFEAVQTTFRHNSTAAFDYYPYGNWSDKNGDVGGWYYIQPEPGNESNYVIKQPAVVWYPGNTTVKKDLSANTAKTGTYELSFDVKVSESAKTLNNGTVTGNLVGYCWCDEVADFKFLDLSANWNQRTGDLSTTEWTNIRCRYVITENHTFNQFNLIYWPEGNVGEDNYVLIDNIKVFKVTDGIADESVNIDTIGGGDLEMFNPNNTVQSFNQYVHVENPVVDKAGTKVIDDNRVMFMGGDNKPVAMNIVGPDTLAQVSGTYKVSMKVKKGTASTMSCINFNAWDLMNWQDPINTSSVTTDGWTTVSGYYNITANEARVGRVSLFFCVDKTAAPYGGAEDYVLIDNISIQRVYR